ncbi:MAG: hypothetical protein HC881_00640 [Leptolyngbyaceae cyanobacterium SL_7_1]|nr:hypothetical protein [Leptolyngbyaceae cyanobacterium SL_7_1]
MQIINLKLDFPELKFADLEPLPPGTDSDDIFPRTVPTLGIDLDWNVVEFDTAPNQVAAILAGFKVWFQEPDDRDFGNLEVRVGTPERLSDTRYRIPVTFGLRDWSGDWDDEHGAEVHVVVIGD